MPSPERVQAVLAPPLQQALARLLAARELLAQVGAPGPSLRRIEYASRADREVATAVQLLRSSIGYPMMKP